METVIVLFFSVVVVFLLVMLSLSMDKRTKRMKKINKKFEDIWK